MMNSVSMRIRTHEDIDQSLCGKAIQLEEGFSQVELVTTKNMAVDESGLVHGGFLFGVADYAAMIAVNHPNVVLGAASVKFLKPVKTNERVVAEAKVEHKDGKKQNVTVVINTADGKCFEGAFTCFVLEKHVLAS